MQDYFYRLAGHLDGLLRGAEQYTCWLSAEASDFVRFNHGAIRQPGHVRQLYLSLNLIDGLRHADCTVALAGQKLADCSTLDRLVITLRDQLIDLPDDPYLLVSTEPVSTEQILPSRLPSTADMVDQVLDAARGADLVGILAAGPVYRGFANSFGQRNWHQTASFNLDWSLYRHPQPAQNTHQQNGSPGRQSKSSKGKTAGLSGPARQRGAIAAAGADSQLRDKAVKTSYAGFDWSSTDFESKFASARERLVLLGRPPVSLEPGNYRAYLAPAALGELVSMLNWDGMSEKSLRTRQSSLRRMRDEDVQLNPAINLRENTADGVAPRFQSDGFIKPPGVVLIEHGKLVGSMVAPRTAREYGIDTNGAGAGEAATSLDLAAGLLSTQQALTELGTGVLISNLWYLNYSDRSSCRITGMTRFATFWVEGGEIVAPLNVMRFDDSVYRVLGDKLVGLTREREFMLDSDSYVERGTGSARMPGALVDALTFVL